MDGEDLLTIDELAHKAGTTVRKVRVYHDRGLLPPPLRKGRVGLYTPEHLHRLQLVLRMLGRGYPLAAIRELIDAWETQRDVGSLLGVEEAITAPYLAERSRRYTAAAFGELLGGDEVAVVRAVEAGIAAVDGEEIVVANPRLLDVALELLGEGFSPRATVDIIAEIKAGMDDVARRCVSFISHHLFADFVKAGMPAGDADRVSAIIQRMRPRVQAAADAALAEAMEEHSAEAFTQTLAHLASKSRRRRKPSAS